jgi:glyoxylase-like metal-dependent hydrolase (beta-lactamase superfamily II)
MTRPFLALALAAVIPTAAQQTKAQLPASPRLYIFDCGTLDNPDVSRYNLKKEEVATHLMAVPCYLVAHPRGILLWDAGVIPDSEFTRGGAPATLRYATSTRPLLGQLASAGYRPADVTYLAFSHFHWDHVANANAFAGATWLAPQPERDIMFAEPPSDRTIPATYSALKNSKTVIVQKDEYDVFGDGAVVIKSTPGHSPGHQVLFLKLAKTGPVVLSGDLYHYPEERTLNRLPNTEYNQEQTVRSRAALEAFLKRTGAQLWIQHDYTANAKLRKAPAYYE